MFTFTFQPKNVFYRNLHYPIQDGLSLLISKSVSHNFPKKMLPTLICLWCTLTCLCTVISRSSLMRLLFAIVIDSALMPSWLVKTVSEPVLYKWTHFMEKVWEPISQSFPIRWILLTFLMLWEIWWENPCIFSALKYIIR